MLLAFIGINQLCLIILKFVNGQLGKPRVLTHAVTVTYAEEAAFFETDTDPASKEGFELEVSAAIMGPLGGATHLLNRAVDEMVKEYLTTAEMLRKMLSVRPVSDDRETQINLAQSLGDVVNIIEKEVYMVICALTNARNHAGYIMLQGIIALKTPMVSEK